MSISKFIKDLAIVVIFVMLLPIHFKRHSPCFFKIRNTFIWWFYNTSSLFDVRCLYISGLYELTLILVRLGYSCCWRLQWPNNVSFQSPWLVETRVICCGGSDYSLQVVFLLLVWSLLSWDLSVTSYAGIHFHLLCMQHMMWISLS